MSQMLMFMTRLAASDIIASPDAVLPAPDSCCDDPIVYCGMPLSSSAISLAALRSASWLCVVSGTVRTLMGEPVPATDSLKPNILPARTASAGDPSSDTARFTALHTNMPLDERAPFRMMFFSALFCRFCAE